MKNYGEFKFPEADVHCRAVVPYQVRDVEKGLQYVRKFDLVVQAGGNVGVWPDYLSDKFDMVMTFEPDPENFECLKQNVDAKNVYAFPSGLGDKTIGGKMVGNKDNCGAYQMEEGGDIPIVRLDDLRIDPDFICLDIEGMEMLALMGAEETIKKHKPVIMIEDKNLSEKYGYKKGDCGEWLKQFGYELKEEIHRDFVYVCDLGQTGD